MTRGSGTSAVASTKQPFCRVQRQRVPVKAGGALATAVEEWRTCGPAERIVVIDTNQPDLLAQGWQRFCFVGNGIQYGYTALTQLDCLDDCLEARRACAMSCLGVNRHFACSLGWGQGLIHVLYHVSGVACCDTHGRQAWQHLAMLLRYDCALSSQRCCRQCGNCARDAPNFCRTLCRCSRTCMSLCSLRPFGRAP